MHMPNFNDAKITSVYVNALGSVADIQDDAPNASTPGSQFDVTVEMVAGMGLNTQLYTLSTSCTDITDTTAAPAVLLPGSPLNSTTVKFGDTPEWKQISALYMVFNNSLPVGPGVAGHVYQYTAALYNGTGQVVSIKQSEPFILL
jgi:hypothetical protein